MSDGKKEILLGDCLELMKDIPNGSIDMILCDLPYGTTACKWDTIIPFEPLWEQYKRIIKDNGAIVLTASQPFTSALVMSNVKMFKYEWIYGKNKASNPFLSKYNPMKIHENVIVFCKGSTIYNPQKEFIGIKDKRKTFTQKKKFNELYGTEITTYSHSKDDGTRFPKSIINFNNANTTIQLHPTQKPVALFEYLIKTYTNEGDLVLDNCAGSGTTAIACLKTKRQFIVMEKERKYYDIILKRVADFNKNFEQQTLFGNEM